MPATEAISLLEGLVATKLVPATPDPRAIVREALVAPLLDAPQSSAMTAIVAPAGSGKSTLMAQLHAAFAARGIATCWLSLDAEDNDPATFAIYFISAVDCIDHGFARDELIALEANPVRDYDLLFDRLVGRLSVVTTPRAIFLDDFQHIADPRILRFLDKLIARLPRSLRLVIASRASLPLQLARLRVAGGLTEFGQDELNFDSVQAGQFLKRYHELELAPGDLASLVESTEGWPTGVQLAALALRRHKGPAGDLIKTFSGRDRGLTRYLVESVLRSQPGPVRNFLLRTAPLRRMCADLCRAATGQADSEALLDYVGRANLFLIPLDREGHWYRYHHLFAEFLQAEFRRCDDAGYRDTCRLAARWCEANGQPAEAIRYALDGEHFEEAAELIARHAPRVSLYRGDHYTVLDWVRRLPPQYHDQRPEILLAHAWSCAFSRETALAMRISQRALTELAAGRPNRWQLPEDERARLEFWARNVQAAAMVCADDIDNCLALSNMLRPLVPPDEPFLMGTVANCLGYSYHVKRDFEKVREVAMDAHEYGHRADAAYLSGWGDFLHGLADVELGELGQAELCCRSVQKDSQGLGLGQKGYIAGLSSLLSAEIAIQRCDFARAQEAIVVSRAFKEIFGPAEPQLVAVRNEARLLAHLGQLDQARRVLQEGQDGALREQHTRLHVTLATEEAALQLTAGEVVGANETARRWRLRGDAADAPRPGLFRGQRDALRLLEARFRLAEDEPEAALRLLTLLQQARGAETRGGFFLSVATHRALALWSLGKHKEALRQLDVALESAAADFHAWPIASAGRALLPLLDAISERRPDAEVADLRARLALQNWLAAYLRGERNAQRPEAEAKPAEKSQAAELLEALTGREVELLRLLQSGLDNKRLADAVLLSEATVKWHLHNVYGKLGVRSRGAAVARAARLGLI